MPDGRFLILSDYAGGDGAATGGAGHVVVDSWQALTGYGARARLVAGFGRPPAPATTLGGADLRDGGRGAVRAVWNGQARSRLADTLAAFDPATTVVILHQWTRYLTPAAVALLRPYPLMVYLNDHFWACPNGAYYDFPAGEACDRQPLGPRCLAAQCDRAGRVAKLGRVARHLALGLARAGGAGRRVLVHVSRRSHDVIAPLMPAERHLIVNNPLAVPALEPARAAAPTFDVGYLGRLEPEKGVGDLLAAIRANRWSALMVGEGSLAAAAASTPGVTWRRWQPRAEMPAAMRQCRAVALPSRWPETWGLVMPEAMAAGVPVLASTRAGSAGLVERFGGGAVFDPAIPGDLARALGGLLAAPPPPLGERWAAFRHALSADRHAERLVTLARDLWGIALSDSDQRPSTIGASSRVSASPAARQV